MTRFEGRRERGRREGGTNDLMVRAAVVCNCQAPPAVTFLQDRHFQIPTAVRLVASYTKRTSGKGRGQLDSKRESQKLNPLIQPPPSPSPSILQPPNQNREKEEMRTFPQKSQVYVPCCQTSIFLTVFRSEAPYRTPYFPVIPTFLVRLD